MPFTIFHGLASFSLARLFTRDKRLLLLAFVGGLAPDLDGLGLLFSQDWYYQFHHELLHPPIMGILLGVFAAIACRKLFNLHKTKTIFAFAAFTGGFLLHLLVDLFFTNWPIKLLWPLSQTQYSFASLVQYNLEFAALTVTAALLATATTVILDSRRNSTTRNK